MRSPIVLNHCCGLLTCPLLYYTASSSLRLNNHGEHVRKPQRGILAHLGARSVFKGNVATAGINSSMSTCWNQHLGVFSLTGMPSVCFAMATLYLSKRDQRRERNLRASTVLSEVSEEVVRK